MKKSLTAVIEKTSTGFSGYIKEYGGIIVVGDSISEMKDNFREAIELNFGTSDDIKVLYAIDLQDFFKHFKVLNKAAFAKYIGIHRSLLQGYSQGLVYVSEDRLSLITEGLHRLVKEFSGIILVK